MTTPTPDEIETLLATETYWRLKSGRFDSENIKHLREVLAGKDAEREKQNKQLLAVAQGYKLDKEEAEAELAALRAELSCCSLAAARRRGLLEKIREYFSKQDSSNAAEFVHLIDCGFEHDRAAHVALKAAERNTAEPEYDIYAARMEKQRQDAAEDRAKEIASTQADTAPVVEVTEGDRNLEILIRDIRQFEERPAGSIRIDMQDVRSILSLYDTRTEAEARGRREALEAATARLEWYRQYGAGMIDQRGFAASLIVELKRLMTEPKP